MKKNFSINEITWTRTTFSNMLKIYPVGQPNIIVMETSEMQSGVVIKRGPHVENKTG